MSDSPRRTDTRKALKAKLGRLLFSMILGISGLVIVGLETSWMTSVGVFLMLWGSNHGLLAKYETSTTESVIRRIGRK